MREPTQHAATGSGAATRPAANGTATKGQSGDASISALEAKLDALIAYTQSLESANRSLAEQSSLWQKRYQTALDQQANTRQRLEQLLDHLKTLETPQSP
ncbi:MAG TPA: hypothetical protein VIC26_14035 [Marinagarivorans sp.]